MSWRFLLTIEIRSFCFIVCITFFFYLRYGEETPSHTIEKFAKDFGDSFSDDDNDDKRPVFNEKMAYRAIAMFMRTAEEVSPLTVEDHYFKKMIKALNQKFYVFFGTLECTCLDIYKEQKAKVQQILKNLDRRVSCSIDLVRHDAYNATEYNYELPEGQTVFDYMA